VLEVRYERIFVEPFHVPPESNVSTGPAGKGESCETPQGLVISAASDFMANDGWMRSWRSSTPTHVFRGTISTWVLRRLMPVRFRICPLSGGIVFELGNGGRLSRGASLPNPSLRSLAKVSGRHAHDSLESSAECGIGVVAYRPCDVGQFSVTFL